MTHHLVCFMYDDGDQTDDVDNDDRDDIDDGPLG